MIPSGMILLGGSWLLGHLLILIVINDGYYRRRAVILAIMFLIVAYMVKPYTYDLEKYSIYFVTGYIPTFNWHTPHHDGFQLDPRDTSGEPYTAYEPGFRWLSKVGNFLLPAGSLVPRYDATYWDFRERAPPRHDALVSLFMILAAASLIFTVKGLFPRIGFSRKVKPDDMALASLVILGSIFFFVGSQNAIRQFLGLVIVLSAINTIISRRYVASFLLVLLANLFHRYAFLFGIIVIAITIGLSWSLKFWPEVRVRPLRIMPFEVLLLFAGIVFVLSIKGLAVAQVFHTDLPLIMDLKPYVVQQDRYQTFERLTPWIKAAVIIFLVVLSEVMQGATSINRPIDIRLLRRAVLFFIIPLAIFPEIFARVLFLYWAIELVFVSWALLSEERRTRVAGAVIFIAYGIAPNVINILLGPDWLHLFL